MTLHAPFFISSRLLPAVKIGNGEISLTPTGKSDREGRAQWRWIVDIDGKEFSASDLHGRGGYKAMFGTLLAFLGAAGEAYRYNMANKGKSDNSDLFPPEVMEYAYLNSDEIGMLAFDVEEGELPTIVE